MSSLSFWILGTGALLLVIVYLVWWLWSRVISSRTAQYKFIQIIPSKDSDLDTLQVRELLKKLHQDLSPKSLMLKLRARAKNLCLYIDAQEPEGIKLIIGIPAEQLDLVKDLVLAIDPSLEVVNIDYYQKEALGDPDQLSLVNYRLSRHYAYPLKVVYSKSELDPLIALSSVLAKLEAGERVILSLSVASHFSLRTTRLRDRLLQGETPVLQSRRPMSRFYQLAWLIIKIAIKLISLVLGIINELTKPQHPGHKRLNRPTNQPITIDNPLSVSMLDKLYEPLFKSSLRLQIYSPSTARRKLVAQEINLCLHGWGDSGYQRLKPTRRLIGLVASIDKRLIGYSYNPLEPRELMSASEIASFYHLPQVAGGQLKLL